MMRVLICHWNRPDECVRTLRAFQAQTQPTRITIFDNNSRPACLARLRTQLPGTVELLPLEKNFGWGPALNVGLRSWLRRDSSQYCAISAHDALPEPRCLEHIVTAMERDPSIGIGSAEYGVPLIPVFSALRGARTARVAPRAAGRVEDVLYPHGTLFVVRRACIEHVGGFDERYFAYGCDEDLGLRARRRGWRVAVVWGAVVRNPGSWTPRPAYQYLYARNSLLLARRFGGASAALARSALMIANSLRLLLTDGFRNCVRERLSAVHDFYTGRWGLLPREFLTRT